MNAEKGHEWTPDPVLRAQAMQVVHELKQHHDTIVSPPMEAIRDAKLYEIALYVLEFAQRKNRYYTRARYVLDETRAPFANENAEQLRKGMVAAANFILRRKDDYGWFTYQENAPD